MKLSFKIVLLLIFLLGFVLRFYNLGQNPPSLDWDEASLGYNAYSILKTGADEYGTKFPLAFRSFGDYKPPLYVYLTVPAVAVFGLNEFAVRFPSALFGALTVIVVYFLVKELFPKLTTKYHLLATLLMAISPWSLQFSRVAFEANIALFFFILGALFFLKGTKEGKFLLLSSFSFALSFYTYHSSRLVVPLLLLGFVIYFRQELWQKKKWVLASFILGVCLLLPLLVQLTQNGQARFSSVTSLTPQGTLDKSIEQTNYDLSLHNPLAKIIHNRRIIYFLTSLGGYLDHWDFNFLFLKGDPPGRHHAAGFGMLYFWDLPFILIGIYFLIKRKEKGTFPLFWWFLVAPVASAVTTGTPHAVRALLYLPTFQIFSAYGVLTVYNWTQSVKNKYFTLMIHIIRVGIPLLLFLNFFYYLHLYYVHTPLEASQDWQYGYKQVVEKVGKIQRNFKKVIVTYHYDQPHVFFLFYQKIDPAWYQKLASQGDIERFNRSFGQYEFRNISWEKDSQLKNVLIVGSPTEIPAGIVGEIKEIKFLNGEVAFRIVAR